MKNRISKKSIATTLIAVVLFSVFSLLGTGTPTAYAATLSKPFEFGAGTANSVSNARTFSVPCGLPVSVKVEYYRLGSNGAQNNVPIVIELRAPGATPEAEGAVVQQVSATAKTMADNGGRPQTATLSAAASSRGCELPWKVRVRPASGTSPLAIKGTISFSFASGSKNIDVEGSLISLNKGNSVTKNLGNSSGLSEGTLTMTATWLHAIGPVPGPLPVKLKFELIDPSGIVVAQSSGFTSNEINPNATPKFRLTFNVPRCKSGQWKIRIINNTNDDTMNINPKVTLTPGCN